MWYHGSMKIVQTSLRIPADVHEALAKVAAAESRSNNRELLHIIREFLAGKGYLPTA